MYEMTQFLVSELVTDHYCRVFAPRNKHGRIFVMADEQWRLSSSPGTGLGAAYFCEHDLTKI